MEIVYKTQEDINKEYQEKIANLKEEDKSAFVFSNEFFYYIGGGHCFVNGFYNEYITKSGIIGTQYSGNRWRIGKSKYNFKNDIFKEIIYVTKESVPINWDDFSFPVVKNVLSKTISDDLISIKPI